MKILNFTLGSPSKRLKFFDSIFLNHDVIFFGPSDEIIFEAKGKKFPVICLNREMSINELYSRLPEDWMPDIVMAETPVLNYIPDFYNCPSPTFCSSRDAWGEMIYNHNIASLFDFVWYQTINKKEFDDRATLLPFFAGVFYSKLTKNKIPYDKRKIDILAVANYNDGFYHERYKLFCMISNYFSGSHIVKFVTGIQQNQLQKYYSNSKIIIDWCSVISIRVFDAAVNGCLAFSFKHNTIVSDAWEEGIEYVGFDNDTIIAQLEHYLNKPNEAQVIINNTNKKLKTLPAYKGSLREEFVDYCLNNLRLTKRNKNLSDSEIHHATATSLYFNYEFPRRTQLNWKSMYFERIEKALSLCNSQNLKKVQLIEALRMAYLLNDNQNFDKYKFELESIFPEYPWTFYLSAQLSLKNNQREIALQQVNKAIELYKENSKTIIDFKLPFYEKRNSPDARRILNFMWQSVHVLDANIEEKFFLYSCYNLLGDISFYKKDHSGAVTNYSLAVEQIPVPACMHKLLKLLIDEKKYQTAVAYVNKNKTEYPYDIISFFLYTVAFCMLKDKRMAMSLIKQLNQTFKAFECKVRYLNRLKIQKLIIWGALVLRWCPNSLFYYYCKISVVVLHKISK